MNSLCVGLVASNNIDNKLTGKPTINQQQQQTSTTPTTMLNVQCSIHHNQKIIWSIQMWILFFSVIVFVIYIKCLCVCVLVYLFVCLCVFESSPSPRRVQLLIIGRVKPARFTHKQCLEKSIWLIHIAHFASNSKRFRMRVSMRRVQFGANASNH